MLTNTYKVYNSASLKSVRICGLQLVKELIKIGFDKETVSHCVRQLKRSGSCHLSPLSIDLVKAL